LEHEGESGKTEMWVVLHADPGAEIIFGFAEGITEAAFAEAVHNESIESLLHRLPVKSGDVIFVPAGAIHALGPGIIVAEIQQNSDTTYRIYDWGRPRPLHIEQALDVLNFALVQPTAVEPKVLSANGIRHESIGHCPYFQTERLFIDADHIFTGACTGLTFEIWGVLSGSIRIQWQDKALQLKAIDWMLLPAAMGSFLIKAQMDSTLLRIYTP
jgi:mannose-6-phosphate isomerase